MSNPNFDPQLSSDTVWYGDQEAVCLTDVVDGKAEADHTHTEYADTDHTHDGYAPTSHAHDNYAPSAHSHQPSEVTGLAVSLASKADLVGGKVPASQLPSYVDDVIDGTLVNTTTFNDVNGNAVTPEDGKVYNDTTSNKSYRWSGTQFVVLNEGVALGETSATAYRGDRGKTAYDHSQNGDVHVTAAQKAAWDGKAAGDHTHDYADADHNHVVYSGASASTYKLVYVGPNGNDNNNGSSAAPMATIKGAIRKYAEKHSFLDIRLLDGTYNEDIGAIGTNTANLSIRSVSENKDAVTINMATQLDLNSGLVRLYNMTLNVTATGVRGISANAGALYAYNIRINIPAGSTVSCVNVYNGTHAFLMNCVLNAGTGSGAGAAIYGNQALLIKAINCSSERKVNVGVHAHNGTDIEYTDTINATTKAKTTSWGKCTLRS